MRKILILISIFLLSFSNAQEKEGLANYFLINTGYSNLNGNYFKLGPELYFVQESGHIINLSATANMAYFKDKYILVPELGIGYLFNTKNPFNKANPYKEYINASFYTVRVNASPWNITPEIGLTLIGILEFNAGYSFEYRKHGYTHFDGIKFGLTLHIPTQIF